MAAPTSVPPLTSLFPSRRSDRFQLSGLSFLLISGFIVLCPLGLLLLDPAAGFGDDWYNNLWMIGYTAQHVLHRGELPQVYNGVQVIGIAFPAFYGPLLFPCLGLISTIVGANLGLRVGCVAVWALQYTLVFRTVRAAGGSRLEAGAFAAMMCWAVYPLTNLYNRNAIAEFFATSLLLSGLCSCALALLGTARWRAAHAVLGGLLLTAAAGSHAVTAALGAVAILVLAPAMLLSCDEPAARQRRVITMALMAATSVLVLSPWIYAVVSCGGALRIEQGRLWYFPSIDSIRARVWPIPLASPAGAASVDAQFSVAMLFLLLWMLASSRHTFTSTRSRWCGAPLLAAGSVLFAATLALSVSPALGNILPRAARDAIQFYYRLVTYQNLGLLAAAAGVCRMRSSASEAARGWGNALGVGIALLLAFVALSVKLAHARAALTDFPTQTFGPGKSDALLNLPEQFFGYRDYSIAGRPAPAAAGQIAGITLPVRGGDQFGRVGSIRYNFPRDMWIGTNIVAFPWNHIQLDGSDIGFSGMFQADGLLVLPVPAGLHTIGFEFRPDPMWQRLRTLSFVLFAGWSLLAAILWALAGWQSLAPKLIEPRPAGLAQA